MQQGRAKAVKVAGLILAAVIPVLLCVSAWHQAETARGLGADRGWFSVNDDCGDQQVHNRGFKNESYSYTCTGIFDGPSATGVHTSLTSARYYRAGDRLRAYISDGDVTLASGSRAAVILALWVVVACGVAYVEVTGARMLDRRIRGVPRIRRRPVSLGHVVQFLLIGVGLYLLVLVPLVIAWWGD